MASSPAAAVTLAVLTSLLTHQQCVTWVGAVRVEVLAPVRVEGTQEVGLIIVPGAYITGHAYRPLGEAIQANTTTRLWVALLEDFLAHLANPFQIGEAMNLVVSKVKAMGLSSDVMFIAGHSLGGGVVSSYIQSHSDRFHGAFFFGHYPEFHLSQTPLPVMTLSGDLDGLARLTHMMDKFVELSKLMESDADSLHKTPVLLLRGVNHGQFASGPMPKAVKENDIEADVTMAQAHALIASRVRDFLSLHAPMQMTRDETQAAEAKASLLEAYNDTSAIYQPLLTTRALDENEAMTSQTSIISQSLTAGVNDDNLKITDHVVRGESDMRTQEPTLEPSRKGGVMVSTVTHVVPHDSAKPFVYSYPLSPHELQVKMISRERILDHLSSNGTVMPTVVSPQSCRSLNQHILQQVLSRSSDAARGRYLSRGARMVTLPDVLTKDSAIWISRRLRFQRPSGDSDMSVTSATYRGEEGWEEGGGGSTVEGGGVVFCKLLSPFRAMEWIYVDSLMPFVDSSPFSVLLNTIG